MLDIIGADDGIEEVFDADDGEGLFDDAFPAAAGDGELAVSSFAAGDGDDAVDGLEIFEAFDVVLFLEVGDLSASTVMPCSRARVWMMVTVGAPAKE